MCGICGVQEHPTDECPSLQEEEIADVNALGGYIQNSWKKYDLYSNKYNLGWRYGNNGNDFSNSGQRNQNSAPSRNDRIQSLEEIVRSLAVSTESSISELKDQISKLTTSVTKLENKGKLPSQPDINPRQNASAISLRSGKEIPSAENTSLPLRDHATVLETEKKKTPKSSKEAPVMVNLKDHLFHTD